MSVLISNDAELDTLLDAQEVEHICEVVLAAEGVEREVEISLSYVDEDEIARAQPRVARYRPHHRCALV